MPLRHHWNDAAVFPGLINDGNLNVLNRYRGAVKPFDTRRLAWSGAQSTGELWKVVGGLQTAEGLAPFVSPNEVVPVRDEITQRTAGMAEGHTTVHAPARLVCNDGQQSVTRSAWVDLFPVLDALFDWTTLRLLSSHIHKAVQISHETPP